MSPTAKDRFVSNYNGAAFMGTTAGERQNRSSRRGIALVLAMFLFGAAMTALLFRAPRSADRAPDVPMAPPRRTLRIVSINLRGRLETGESVGRWLKQSDADVYLVQGVRTGDVESIGKQLGMSRPGGCVFYPAQNLAGPSAPFGNAIFSRFPMYESRSIPSRGGSFGVWAVVVVDDVQFLLASIDTTDSEAAVGRGASADVERAKELTMLADAFAATRQAIAIVGAHVPGWDQYDEAALHGRQAVVQMIAGDDPAERAMTISRLAGKRLMIERVALPDDPPGAAAAGKVSPGVSGG
jgi:hypothetical protein